MKREKKCIIANKKTQEQENSFLNYPIPTPISLASVTGSIKVPGYSKYSVYSWTLYQNTRGYATDFSVFTQDSDDFMYHFRNIETGPV